MLKKFGLAMLNIASKVPMYGQLITPFLPQKAQAVVQTAMGDLQQLAAIVSTTEAMAANIKDTKLTGSQKLNMATPLVAQYIHSVELISGKHPKDAAQFEKGVASLTSGMADILSSFGD